MVTVWGVRGFVVGDGQSRFLSSDRWLFYWFLVMDFWVFCVYCCCQLFWVSVFVFMSVFIVCFGVREGGVVFCLQGVFQLGWFRDRRQLYLVFTAFCVVGCGGGVGCWFLFLVFCWSFGLGFSEWGFGSWVGVGVVFLLRFAFG